jgi:hypothetical protein
MDLGIKQLGGVMISILVIGGLIGFVNTEYKNAIISKISSEITTIGTTQPATEQSPTLDPALLVPGT